MQALKRILNTQEPIRDIALCLVIGVSLAWVLVDHLSR